MKVLHSIIRVFAASVNAVAASLQAVQGGGGVLKKRAADARFSGVFSDVLFAVFGGFAVVDDAAAVGVDYVNGDLSKRFVVANYPTAAAARAAAFDLCIADGAPSNCPAATSANTTVFTDEVLARVDNLAVVAADQTAARTSLIAACETTTGLNTVACTNVINDGARYCGDGAAHPTTPNDCTAVYVAPTGVSDCPGQNFDDDGTTQMCVDTCPMERNVAVSGVCTMQAACDAATEVADGMAGCTCADGFNDAATAGVCVADLVETPGMTVIPPANTATVTPPENGGDGTGGGSGDDDISDSGDGRNHAPVFVFGGLMLMGAVGYIMSGGDLDAFAFSPALGYSVNESGYSANVGGRMDFQKDEWRLFWTVGQANANGEFGEFRYSSGGEYKADFWKASFSESVQGKTANYDLSLSADLSGGIWSLSPVYRIHSRLEEGKTDTRNSLNLEGVLRYDGWQIRQSAGFGWRRANEFGDNARFRLEMVREF